MLHRRLIHDQIIEIVRTRGLRGGLDVDTGVEIVPKIAMDVIVVDL